MLGPELSGDLPCRWWVILSEELLQSFDHGCVALRPEHSAQVFFAGRSAVGDDLGKPVALGGGCRGRRRASAGSWVVTHRPAAIRVPAIRWTFMTSVPSVRARWRTPDPRPVSFAQEKAKAQPPAALDRRPSSRSPAPASPGKDGHVRGSVGASTDVPYGTTLPAVCSDASVIGADRSVARWRTRSIFSGSMRPADRSS